MDPAVSQSAEDGAKRNGSRSNRQSKKGEQQKLKDCEQEEQLKLARSLIGNLERKIIELENSNKKVQVGKDQEKAQSEKDSHSKNRGGKKPN